MSVKDVLLRLNEKRYKQMQLFKVVPQNPDIGDKFDMPLELLDMNEKSVRKTLLDDLYMGRFSQSKGEIDVWYSDEERYAITDGYHRAVEAMLLGIDELRARVEGIGYSSYWSLPREGERFEYRPEKEFKGLELFAEDSILEDIREELIESRR